MAPIRESSDSVTEYGDVLTPSNIAKFLAANNWTCQVDRTYDQVWLQPSDVSVRVVPVLLPREPSFVDYERRLTEAALTIAQVYGWRISNLAEQVAAVHADLFFVRVNQYSQDGTIPFRQATALLENIDQMIRSAAVHAYNPKSTGRGRIPVAVNDFLNDDVRMGHTKKGSFIITVAARIDDLSEQRPERSTPAPASAAAAQSDSHLETDTHAADENDGISDVQHVEGEEQRIEDEALRIDDSGPLVQSPSVPSSFTRQVMTTLARSLDVTRRHISRGDDAVSFEEAVDEGLRLSVVHALHEIGEAEGLQSIDLMFEWATIEPQQIPVPSHIVLDRDVIDALPELEARLTKAIAPSRITIIGPVTELKRADSDDASSSDEEGEIVVRAEVDGRVRRVVVTLTGPDYDWAIRAHREKLPFTVTGELGKRGNVWCLNEPIEVDRSFLEFRLRNS